MDVLVTGANGHVGGNLVRALLDRGDRVRALVHNREDALEGLPVEIVRGDVRDRDDMKTATAGAELVFHLAARISIDGPHRGLVESINVDGTRTAAEAALAAGVRRFVHVSSIHAIEKIPAESAIDEQTPRETADRAPAYDRSKAAAEAVLRRTADAGLDIVIVNPTAIIGPFDFAPSRMGRVLIGLADGRISGLVRGSFDWVDVRDVVAGAIAASERGRSGENYLLPGQRTSLVELADLAASVTGTARPRMVVPLGVAEIVAPLALGASRLLRREPMLTPESLMPFRWDPVIVRDKAAAELGYEPRPLADTIADTIAWFAEAGMLRRADAIRERIGRS